MNPPVVRIVVAPDLVVVLRPQLLIRRCRNHFDVAFELPAEDLAEIQAKVFVELSLGRHPRLTIRLPVAV